MLIKKIKARCPSAEKIEPVTHSQYMIRNHIFKFHKKSSKDFSAKGDVERTNNIDDVVYGVLFSIKKEEKRKLDREEGLHYGYEEKTVYVFDEKSSGVLSSYPDIISAITYYATDIDSEELVFDVLSTENIFVHACTSLIVLFNEAPMILHCLL